MFQTDEIWNQDEIRTPVAEPMPFIDYNLIQEIIIDPSSKLDKRELDGFTSLIEARKLYYSAQYRFQFEYNGLQDARAYDMTLRAEKMKLEYMGEAKNAKLWNKFDQVTINIQKNRTDIEALEKQVQLRWQKRNDSTAEFGRKKTEFDKTIWPGFMKASEQPNVKARLETTSAAATEAKAIGPAPAPTPSTSFYYYDPRITKYSPSSLPPRPTPLNSTSNPSPLTMIYTPTADFDCMTPSDSVTLIGGSPEYRWVGMNGVVSGEEKMEDGMEMEMEMEMDREEGKGEKEPGRVNYFEERIISKRRLGVGDC